MKGPGSAQSFPVEQDNVTANLVTQKILGSQIPVLVNKLPEFTFLDCIRRSVFALYCSAQNSKNKNLECSDHFIDD